MGITHFQPAERKSCWLLAVAVLFLKLRKRAANCRHRDPSQSAAKLNSNPPFPPLWGTRKEFNIPHPHPKFGVTESNTDGADCHLDGAACHLILMNLSIVLSLFSPSGLLILKLRSPRL